MTRAALDFAAYRDLKTAAEAAEALILRLRAKAFELLEPDREQSLAAFADLVGELENAPEIALLRRALGREGGLPPSLEVRVEDQNEPER